MPLAAGTRLGPYEIVDAIGAGGMGEVYRARDTRLDRTVAIKVLPESLAGDPQFRERFEREAKTISQLNHPHICTLHDLGREGDVDYLVMEFVEGETLEHRLRLGAIAIPEAMSFAQQIAGALEAAHEKGIVHRDLKPANIKVTPDGSVKVLDFGLAKNALAGVQGSAQLSMSPTVFAGATQAGVILGTAAYMSPEQARGLPVDKRADIWAFGCVLYQMLTAKQVFSGTTATDIIAAIVREEPALDALPSDVPPSIPRVLRRCLQKDQKRRLRDIADVFPDLDEALNPVSPPRAQADGAPAKRGSLVVPMAVAAALIASAFLTGSWWRARQQPAATEWIGERLGGSAVAFNPRLSPDGQTLAFMAMVDGQTQVAVMKPQSGTWTVLTHSARTSHGGVQDLCWSRDGTRIFYDAFFDVPQGIFSVSALGGDERLVLDNAESPHALADGSLLVTRINAARIAQLYRLSLETGQLDALPALIARSTTIPAVRVFPDGREAVFFGRPSEPKDAPDAVYAIDLQSKHLRRLAPSDGIDTGNWATPLSVTHDGRWVRFAQRVGSGFRIVETPRDGSFERMRSLATLMSRPNYMDVGSDGAFYVDQLVQSAELVSWSPAGGQIAYLELPAVFSTSSTATSPGALQDGRILLQAQTAGRDQLMVVTAGKAADAFVDTTETTSMPAAPVGANRVAFLIGAVPNRKVAIASLDGHIQRRLTRIDGNDVVALAGSPDGRTLFYVRSGIVWAVPTDESAEPKKIHEGDSVAVDPGGTYLVVKLQAGEKISLVRVSLSDGAEQPIPVAGDLRLTLDVLSPTAVRVDGRIAVRVGWKDSWWWPAAILDPSTGAVTPISRSLNLDMMSPGWTPDGRIVAVGLPVQSTMWRFRPAPAAR